VKQTVIIDGKWLGYKMHFSHLSLKTSEGKPTGMLHGFLLELLRLNRKLPQARIIICWDGKGKTWRHRIFPAYKQNRQYNPERERMIESSEVLLPLLRRLGFHVLREDGVEADDMIGMASKALSYDGWKVLIYAKDRDFYQLIRCDDIMVWHDLKEKPLDENAIKNMWGVVPGCVTDIRAMAGDMGDNLRGLPGVGLVTAIKYWKRGLMPDGMEGPKELIEKYKEHWPRIRKELRCAEIVTLPDSEWWLPVQRERLKQLMWNVVENPGRDKILAEKNRREVYKTLVGYELEQLLAERNKFFTIP
jgi:DNA polymerase I